jgi:hypothetical protein
MFSIFSQHSCLHLEILYLLKCIAHYLYTFRFQHIKIIFSHFMPVNCMCIGFVLILKQILNHEEVSSDFNY